MLTSHFKGADFYCQLLDSFSDYQKLPIDLDSNLVSKSIYLDIAKMKHAGWRMKINFRRHKRHTTAEFFQDIIAYYLNCCLPDGFDVELENKVDKIQTDIAIKKNGNFVFLIEVKTNIGYERPDMSEPNPYEKFEKRVKILSQNFKVPKENIIYIFEDHGNVSKAFSEKFWDKDLNQSKELSTEFPFSITKPLFNKNDSYYQKYEKGFDHKKEYKPIDEEIILKSAEENIVTRFEEIVKLIILRSNYV